MKNYWKGKLGFVVMVLALAVWSGCAPRASQLSEAQAAVAGATPPDQDKYALGPDDQIEISVWKEPELTKQIVINPDGRYPTP